MKIELSQDLLCGSVFNKAPIAVELFDLNGLPIHCNPACLELFGISGISKLINFNLFQDPVYSAELVAEIKAGKSHRYVLEFDFDLVRELNLYNAKKTGILYLDCSIVPLYSDENVLNCFALYILDITESKKAEKALIESNEKYINLFEANIDGISIFKFNDDETTSKFIEINNNGASLLGYSKEEMLSMYPSDVEKIKSLEAASNRKKELKEKGFVNFETIVIHKDGHDVPLEIRVLVINYHNQPALMTIVRDISEQKNKENQLLEYANKLNRLIADKDKFITILAHDLRSPFSCLLGFSDLLAENVRSYNIDKIENQVTLINQVSHQTFDLLEEILSRQSESKESIKEMMRNSNPAVIPRNHMVEEALEAVVERKDYSVMEKLLEVISNPYDYALRHGKYYDSSDINAEKYQTFCGT
jgi:PAS domain S-box-containing protein